VSAPHFMGDDQRADVAGELLVDGRATRATR
jgi:hypothetical protein